MTPDRIRACLDLIGWSQRGLAERLQRDERQVRRWCSGDYEIPEPEAQWLNALADFHEQHPAPGRADQ
jgi:ribosome-binding protein aMBF1 (putative translation factor)